MGDGFYRSKDPTNSIKVLKEFFCVDLSQVKDGLISVTDNLQSESDRLGVQSAADSTR